MISANVCEVYHGHEKVDGSHKAVIWQPPKFEKSCVFMAITWQPNGDAAHGSAL